MSNHTRNLAVFIPALLFATLIALLFKEEPVKDYHVAPTPEIVVTLDSEAVVAQIQSTTTTSTITTIPPTTTSSTVVIQSVQKAQPQPVEVPSGEIESLIMARWGPEHGPKAVAVARCESGLNPQASNGSHHGLFQISKRWHEARVNRMGYSFEQMYEAQPNIEVAYAIWSEQGWRPWTCA